MEISAMNFVRLPVLSVCLFFAPLAAAQGDSPWLYGVHWAAEPADSDLESMTGGKGVWVVDQCLLNSTSTDSRNNEWETPWVVSPSVDKTSPFYKPGYFSSVVSRGHTMVVRLHPQWAVNQIYPGDPYTEADFGDDCKAAAGLMKNVHIWLIGNEGNLEAENVRWNPATQDYDIAWSTNDLLSSAPELAAQMYLAARNKIHEVTPDTTPAAQVVLLQAVSPGAPDAAVGRYMHGTEYLARMINAVADKSKIDGFALHAYAAPGGGNFGADSFMNDLKEQLMVIDQAGLGDRPVYVTEFNKHMPDAAEAATGAQFLTTAYQMLHAWNTGSAGIWPGQPNHPFTGTAWFVYRTGWNDYSLLHWKTNASSTSATDNPWYAFQASCAQNYPRGSGAGPVLSPTALWWQDEFDGSSLDQSPALPHWQADTGAGGQVLMSGSGSVRLVGGTTPYGSAGIRTPLQYAFTNYKAVAEVTFTDAGRIADDEANLDFRVREQRGDGSTDLGYSFTFYSSSSGGGAAARAGHLYLRRTSDWGTVYRSAAIAGGVNTGDRFRMELAASGGRIDFKVARLATNTVVVDWSGSNALINRDFHFGGIRMMVYNMREARVDSFAMGGVNAALVPTAARDWALFK